MKTPRHNVILVLTSCILLFLGACNNREQPTIRLIANNWSASEINAEIAKQLLEEEMGYSVEIILLDENEQWAALAQGDAHASLEVWPSGHAQNINEYVHDQESVEYGGALGPVGKIGWYIPSYMIEQNTVLATWEGFQDDSVVTLFATDATGDKGQFLAGDPSWTQYDADIIDNLGLNFEVVQAGSESALLDTIEAAYVQEGPILFYFWTPHAIHAQYDLSEVQLPDYSEDCYEDVAYGGVTCDYPADMLIKIFWADLKEEIPEAYQFLKNMNYSTTEQIAMIAAVELDGLTVEEAARDWIEANESIWRRWLP